MTVSKADERPVICIDLKKNRIRIYKKTFSQMRYPDYIEILVNPKKKSFILKTAPNRKNAHKVMVGSDVGKGNELYSSSFMREVLTITDKLELSRSYRIEGILSPARDAACFYLDDAILIEPEKEDENYA